MTQRQTINRTYRSDCFSNRKSLQYVFDDKLIDHMIALRKMRRSVPSQIFSTIIMQTLQYKQKKCKICQQNVQEYSLCNCEHFYCGECLNLYTVAKIRSNEQINCPQRGCEMPIFKQNHIFKNLAQKDKRLYFKQVLFRQTILNPNLKICPSQHCDQGLIDITKSPIICSECRQEICEVCLMAQHKGEECQKSFAEMERNFQRCRCLRFIERIEGCNHMVCSCGHEFCYFCGRPWNDGHYNCNSVLALRQRNCFCRFFFVLMLLLITVFGFFFLISLIICVRVIYVCFSAIIWPFVIGFKIMLPLTPILNLFAIILIFPFVALWTIVQKLIASFKLIIEFIQRYYDTCATLLMQFLID